MSDDISAIEQKVIEYIIKNTHTDVKKITPQTFLFKEGIFDSMAFVLLIDFIEQAFNIKPSDEDLIEQNFESVEAITKYIHRKKVVHVS